VRVRRSRSLFRLLVTLGWLIALGATFALGYAVASYDSADALAEVDALRSEAARLSEEVAHGRAERVRLERAHQMDREARRQAQQSLAELQRERLALRKRLSYLQRLVRDGDKGVVVIKELQLFEGDAPGRYRFDMVLSQLVAQDLPTQGAAKVRVIVARDGEEQSLTLDELPGSTPATIPIDFDHFQIVRGEIVLPEDLVPQRLIVDIQPDGQLLAPSSEAFLWPVGSRDGGISPIPAVTSSDLVDDGEVE